MLDPEPLSLVETEDLLDALRRRSDVLVIGIMLKGSTVLKTRCSGHVLMVRGTAHALVDEAQELCRDVDVDYEAPDDEGDPSWEG